jgi:hypothetical protein
MGDLPGVSFHSLRCVDKRPTSKKGLSPMANKVTAVVQSPTGRKPKVIADSQAKVDSKLAVMVGTLISEKLSSNVTTPGTLFASSGSYDDAVLYGIKSGKNVNLQLQNVDSSFQLASDSDQIDISAPLIAAIFTAYGVTPTGGHYTRG